MGDVEIISIDMDTGKVEYEIKADSFEEAEQLQEDLIANVTASEIEENIQKVIPEISVDSQIIEEEIEVEVTFVFDGEEVDNVGQANKELEAEMKANGFEEIETKVEIVTALPTQAPIIIT